MKMYKLGLVLNAWQGINEPNYSFFGTKKECEKELSDNSFCWDGACGPQEKVVLSECTKKECENINMVAAIEKRFKNQKL